jgi:mannose-1-phosphate guanylyltransferase
VDDQSKVLGFKEKQSALGKQYVNAGIYLADPRIFSGVPLGVQLSLETDLFPQWLAKGKHLRAFVHPGQCIDIGTPERYQSAQIALAGVELGETLPKPESQRA